MTYGIELHIKKNIKTRIACINKIQKYLKQQENGNYQMINESDYITNKFLKAGIILESRKQATFYVQQLVQVTEIPTFYKC